MQFLEIEFLHVTRVISLAVLEFYYLLMLSSPTHQRSFKTKRTLKLCKDQLNTALHDAAYVLILSDCLCMEQL